MLNTVANCVEFENSKSCKVCSGGFGIKAQDGLNVCVQITSIINCTLQSQIEPYNCLVCATKYYSAGQTCDQVLETSLIPNCVVYSGESSCQQCMKNYILSVDKKKCTVTYAQNHCLSLED